MNIGAYLDGRSLSYDESTGSFAIDDAPVTADQVRAHLQAGQMSWQSPELGTWFETSFPPPASIASVSATPKAPKMNRGVIIAIVVAALILVLAVGYVTAAAIVTLRTKSNDAKVTAETKASIPSLQFIDPSSLPRGANVAVGTTLAPGSYTVFMTGERIQTVQWVKNTNDSRESDLRLRFDAEGAKQFEQLTSQNLGKPLLLAIGGKIILAPVVEGMVGDGTVVLSGSTNLRTIFGPRIVPAPSGTSSPSA